MFSENVSAALKARNAEAKRAAEAEEAASAKERQLNQTEQRLNETEQLLSEAQSELEESIQFAASRVSELDDARSEVSSVTTGYCHSSLEAALAAVRGARRE